MARYVEVVVNVPLRRTFGRRHNDVPPGNGEDLSAGVAAAPEAVHGLSRGAPEFQTFHYHVPPDLEGEVEAGHLVWVPFGRQEVQALVLRPAETVHVSTKPILRLARSQPILTSVQLALATWIAETYVAPLSEAVKLFIPPGLLLKDPDATGVRVKRELQVELLVEGGQVGTRSFLRRLLSLDLGHNNQRIAALTYVLERHPDALSVEELQTACGLKTNQTVQTLARQGLFREEAGVVQLVVSPEEAWEALLELRGLPRYLSILQALAEAGGTLWKGDLHERVEVDLASLRELQTAGLVRLLERVHYRDPLAGRAYLRSAAPVLTGQQASVWEAIAGQAFPAEGSPAVESRGANPRFLLHGVTGSGKTEIYLRAIAETLERGRQAIVLVPEIALTPQTVARFAGRFPGRVTVIHSALSVGERYDVWRRVRDGEFDVVVGPRSALFAPLPRLGLIVIDEEHETSYKQNAEEWGSFTVFYDARAVAARLAELVGCPFLLGSATPSLESYHAAMQGELTLLALPRRVLGHRTGGAGLTMAAGVDERDAQGEFSPRYVEMPPVEVVDMRQELRAGNRSIFSRSLQSELHATLDAGEQAILFLNRRGTSTFVMCRDCGHVQECRQCEVPLTYHERADVLICHHCNRRYLIPELCPACGSRRIKYFGSGTQRIGELVGQIAPRARLLRWDADTTGRKGSHEAILAQFAAHEADVLVGTQMIAKGLDLPMVTLVGVISADVGLYLPDFRSAERTFQLLTQVAGRAGRSQRGGRVVIQTYTPQHYAIQAASQHDFLAFYEREIGFRREHGYPPIRRLARLIYWEKNLEKVKAQVEEMAAGLRRRQEEMGLTAQGIDVIGPAPAFFARYRGYYRWQILVRAPDPAILLRGMTLPFGWRVDVDPVSLL